MYIGLQKYLVCKKTNLIQISKFQTLRKKDPTLMRNKNEPSAFKFMLRFFYPNIFFKTRILETLCLLFCGFVSFRTSVRNGIGEM